MKKMFVYFLYFLTFYQGYAICFYFGLVLLLQSEIFFLLQMDSILWQSLIGIGAISIAIGLYGFLKRYIGMLLMSRRGIKKPGKIVAVNDLKNFVFLVYEYDFIGQTYRANMDILKSRVKWFRVGQSVLVTLDPLDPKRAFLEEAYS